MRNAISKWALYVLGSGAITLCLPACDQGCIDDLTCSKFLPIPVLSIPGSSGGSGSGGAGGTGSGGGTGTGAIECPEDPADGAIAEECGIWVRASFPGNDASPGTQAAPVNTLAQAIALAEAGTRRVYACGEVYPVHVDVPAGMALFGGFDCDQGWKYVGTAKRATIAPTVPGIFAVTLLDGDDKSMIGDINARAMSAVEVGGSSIAMFTMDHAKAELRRVDIIAGDGANGADGEPGEHNGAPAQTGLNGNNGFDACEMAIGLGGAAIGLVCDDGSSSSGGQGGNASEAAANGGGDGQQAPSPNPQHLGEGGKGENGAQGMACSPGIGGAQGFDGVDGLGATNKGQLTMAGQLIGAGGGDGKPGTPGQGGGGGGASLGKVSCGGAPHGGAGGGSGGTGGCTGRGGRGGQAGGSSIGIAARGGPIELYDVEITTGQAGKGGNGGKLQSGGQAGLPGLGGGAFGGGPDPAKKGCAGGAGGYGGNGGHGGGGHGGHSATVAYTAKDNFPPGFAILNFGKAGHGGEGGNPVLFDAHGEVGTASTGVLLEP